MKHLRKIRIACLVFFTIICWGHSAQSQPIELNKSKASETNIDIDIGLLDVELLYDTGESGDPVLKLTIRPEVADNHRIFAFDKERTFRDIMRNLRDHNYSAHRKFLNYLLLPFYSTENNILQLKEEFITGFAAFRNRRTFEFTFSEDFEPLDGTTIDLILQFYYSDEDDQLQSKLDPVPLNLSLVAPVAEALEEVEEHEQEEEEKEEEEKKDEEEEEEEREHEVRVDPCIVYFEQRERDLRRLSNQIQNDRFDNKLNRWGEEVEWIEKYPEERLIEVKDTLINLRDKVYSGGVEQIGDRNTILYRLKIQIERQKKGCANESSFNSLIQKIERKKSELSDLRDSFTGLINRLDSLLGVADPEYLARRDSIRGVYKNDFLVFGDALKQTEEKYDKLRNAFDKKRNSPWYYDFHRAAFKRDYKKLDSLFKTYKDEFQGHNSDADNAFNSVLGVSQSYEEEVESSRDESQRIINRLSDELPQWKEDFDKVPVNNNLWLPMGLGLLVLGLLGFGSFVFVRGVHQRIKLNRKKTNNINTKGRGNNNKKGGLRIVPIEKNYTPGKGLSHVYDKIDREYYEINLENVWEETLVGRVYISRDLIKRVYRFFYDSLSQEGKIKEHGGYILGAWDFNKEDDRKYDVSLEHFIETRDDAINENYELNFGAKIGVRVPDEIRKIREKSGLNFTLTAWIHSHPEINIFLSKSDLNVQETLSNKDYKEKLLALVLDPNTRDNGKIAFNTGIFSYRDAQTMNNNGKGMPLIKWRDLYEWAQTPIPPDMSNNFRIDLNELFSESLASRLYFRDKCIINFSNFLDDIQGRDFAHGVFTGQVINKEYENNHLIVLDDFFLDHEAEAAENNLIGYFFYGKNHDEVIESMIQEIEPTREAELIVVCDNDDKNLLVLTRKTPGLFNKKSDARQTVSFYEIEAWPARRR